MLRISGTGVSKKECNMYFFARTILGDFNFNAMKTAEPFLGPAFFTLYCLYVYFILLV